MYTMVLGHHYLNAEKMPTRFLGKAIAAYAIVLSVRLIWDVAVIAAGGVTIGGIERPVLDFALSIDGIFVWIALFFGTALPLVICYLRSSATRQVHAGGDRPPVRGGERRHHRRGELPVRSVVLRFGAVSAAGSGGTLALSWTCAACGEANASRPAGDGVACDSCGTAVAVEEPHRQFRQCAVCSSTRLYRQRDFSRFLGLAVVVVGAVLVPFTYGLSLPVVFLIDLILYRAWRRWRLLPVPRRVPGRRGAEAHPAVPPPSGRPATRSGASGGWSRPAAAPARIGSCRSPDIVFVFSDQHRAPDHRLRGRGRADPDDGPPGGGGSGVRHGDLQHSRLHAVRAALLTGQYPLTTACSSTTWGSPPTGRPSARSSATPATKPRTSASGIWTQSPGSVHAAGSAPAGIPVLGCRQLYARLPEILLLPGQRRSGCGGRDTTPWSRPAWPSTTSHPAPRTHRLPWWSPGGLRTTPTATCRGNT